MLKNLGNLIHPNCDLNKIALIDLSSDTPESFSFGDIDRLSNAVARGLDIKKIKAGDRIAIVSDNSSNLIVTFFGSLRLGAVPILINSKLTESQIQNILTSSQSKLVFTDTNYKFHIETINFKNNFKQFLNFGNFDCITPNDTDIAFILYTSGSSGTPKSIEIIHKNHIWAITRNAQYDPWSNKRTSLISAPLYHANGLTTFEGSFFGQSTIVLLPKFDSLACIQAIEKYRVDTMYCVPAMLSMMFQTTAIEQSDVSSLRQIRSASSHISQKLADTVKRYFPNASIFNSYGTTEVGPALFAPHPDGIPRPATSVGYPAKGIKYRIVDGILQIKSPSMILNNNKNQSFTEDGFFITNDLFKVDDNGFYYFLGRADDMFKCGGNSVYPTQVEEILESHPAVLSAAVIGIEDDIKGYKPYAFVVVRKDTTIDELELKQYVLDQGPAYQHPRRIWFIDEFPVLAGYKIDKEKLKQMHRNYIIDPAFHIQQLN
jgi:acyl-CoA synthetase (AMP-forming)/AMP-acid ligase II